MKNEIKKDLVSPKTNFGKSFPTELNKEPKKRKHTTVIHTSGHHDTSNFLKFIQSTSGSHLPKPSKDHEGEVQKTN